MTVKKNEQIIGKCRSCGTTSILDSKHRMAAYIIKHPPPIKGGFKAIDEDDIIGNV